MLKKKVASVVTAVVRICPKCGARNNLSVNAITKCVKCGEIVHEEENRDESHK